MDVGGEELGAGGLGLGEFGFQGSAQGQKLSDLGENSFLLGRGWDRERHYHQLTLIDRCNVSLR